MQSKRSRRTSPASRPASQRDVKRAHDEGITFGLNMAIEMMMWCLVEKQGATSEQLQQLNRDLNELAEHVTAGRINMADIESARHEEYGIEVEFR